MVFDPLPAGSYVQSSYLNGKLLSWLICRQDLYAIFVQMKHVMLAFPLRWQQLTFYLKVNIKFTFWVTIAYSFCRIVDNNLYQTLALPCTVLVYNCTCTVYVNCLQPSRLNW